MQRNFQKLHTGKVIGVNDSASVIGVILLAAVAASDVGAAGDLLLLLCQLHLHRR